MGIMLGTKDGYWYCFITRKDGLLDYEIFHYDERLLDGIATEVEMIKQFEMIIEHSSK
jgi:hypothetical protein